MRSNQKENNLHQAIQYASTLNYNIQIVVFFVYIVILNVLIMHRSISGPIIQNKAVLLLYLKYFMLYAKKIFNILGQTRSTGLAFLFAHHLLISAFWIKNRFPLISENMAWKLLNKKQNNIQITVKKKYLFFYKFNFQIIFRNRMEHILFTIFLILLTSARQYLNLVANGDFQQFYSIMNHNDTLEDYAFLPSNTSQWYNINMDFIEIKEQYDFPTSVAADLSSTVPYALCQNLKLEVGKKYRIQYSIFVSFKTQQMTITASINHQQISKLYIPTTQTFGNQTDFFYAKQVIAQLCFNQTHQVMQAYNYTYLYQQKLTKIFLLCEILTYYLFSYTFIYNFSNYPEKGGLIDNISIVIVDFHEVKIEVQIYQQNSTFTLRTNLPYASELSSQFTKRFTFIVEGKPFNFYRYKQSDQNTFSVQFGCKFSFPLNKLQIRQINLQNNQMIEFGIDYCHEEKYFHFIDQSLQQFLMYISKILFPFYKSVVNFTNLYRISFCSYFILTLLSFENLSLMYIFLGIQIVPQFTKQTYYQLLSIYFNSNGINFWIKGILHRDSDPFQLQIQNIKVSDIMQKTKGGRPWFAQYEISSLVFNNNSNSYLLLLFLLFKIMVASYVVSHLNSRLSLRIRPKFKLVFLIEFISMIPSFLISAYPRTIIGYSFSPQKIQKILQICIIFICISSIWLFFMEGVSYNRKKIINIRFYWMKKKQKKQTKQLKVSYYRLYVQTFETLPLLSIPLIISVGDSKLFLISISLIIVGKIIGYFYVAKHKNKFQKVIQFLVNFVWIVHTVVFIVFWSISVKNPEDGKELYERQLVVLGITSIITVLAGCTLELLKFCVCNFRNIIDILKVMIKICKNKRQIYPKREKAMAAVVNDKKQAQMEKCESPKANQKETETALKSIQEIIFVQNKIEIVKKEKGKVRSREKAINKIFS